MVLGSILHREMSRIYFTNSPTTNSATEAGAIGNDIGMTVLVRRMHCFGIELVGTFEAYAAIVSGRQAAETVGDVHHRQRAVARHFGAVSHTRINFIDNMIESPGVLVAHTPGAAYRNRLDFLGTHYRANTGAAGGAMLVVDHAGVAAQRFSRLTDPGKAHQRILVFLRQQVLGFPDGFAPDFTCVADFNFFVFDMQVNRFFRFALDNEQIVTRHF